MSVSFNIFFHSILEQSAALFEYSFSAPNIQISDTNRRACKQVEFDDITVILEVFIHGYARDYTKVPSHFFLYFIFRTLLYHTPEVLNYAQCRYAESQIYFRFEPSFCFNSFLANISVTQTKIYYPAN